MPIFSGSSSGITRYQVKNCTINGTLRNSSTYNVPRPERKRFGTVRKMPKNEPTRKAIIQGADRQSDRHLKTTPDPTKIGGVAERGLVVKKIPQFQSIDINLLQKKKRVAALTATLEDCYPAYCGFQARWGNDHQAYSLSVLRNNREGWNFRPLVLVISSVPCHSVL